VNVAYKSIKNEKEIKRNRSKIFYYDSDYAKKVLRKCTHLYMIMVNLYVCFFHHIFFHKNTQI